MFSDQPIFDEAALDELHELQVEGEPSFVGGLLRDYLAQLDQMVKTIEDHQIRHEIKGLEESSHKLKSSSGALGLRRLQAICAAIEKHAREGKPSPLETVELMKAWPETKDALGAHMTKNAALLS